MKLKLSAYAAIGFGITIGVIEIIRNWGNWQWWPFWLIDFIISALLIVGGFLYLKGSNYSLRFLPAAWGITFGAMYMSFWDHVYRFEEETHGHIPQEPLTYLIGFGLIVCLISLCFSIAGRRND